MVCLCQTSCYTKLLSAFPTNVLCSAYRTSCDTRHMSAFLTNVYGVLTRYHVVQNVCLPSSQMSIVCLPYIMRYKTSLCLCHKCLWSVCQTPCDTKLLSAFLTNVYGLLARHHVIQNFCLPCLKTFLTYMTDTEVSVGRGLWCALCSEGGLQMMTGETRVVNVTTHNVREAKVKRPRRGHVFFLFCFLVFLSD